MIDYRDFQNCHSDLLDRFYGLLMKSGWFVVLREIDTCGYTLKFFIRPSHKHHVLSNYMIDYLQEMGFSVYPNYVKKHLIVILDL